MKEDEGLSLGQSGETGKWPSGSVPACDYIEVMCGPEDGKLFEVRGSVITIGRVAENDICIPLELSVSRRHARLVKTENGYTLEILIEARNAATVRGQIVAPGQTVRLERGDRFKLGDVLFELGARTECEDQ